MLQFILQTVLPQISFGGFGNFFAVRTSLVTRGYTGKFRLYKRSKHIHTSYYEYDQRSNRASKLAQQIKTTYKSINLSIITINIKTH